jgi:GT2 family glycosyltransferase
MGRAFDRGMGGPAEGRFLTPADVDGACMACALFRREALLQARDGAGEILDSRFFAYKEDVDLSWRLRRAGYRIRYLPEASATHERGWREGRRREIPVWIRRLSLRNRWFTILKNESALSLALRMAIYVPWEVAIAGYLLLREPRVLPAYPAILGGLTDTWKRRKLPYAAPTASAGSG